MKELGLQRDTKLLLWNKKLLSCLGIWPEKQNHFIFLVNYVYLGVLCGLGIYDTGMQIRNLDRAITGGIDLITMCDIWLRIGLFKISLKEIEDLIKDIRKDFGRDGYNSVIEFQNFLAYCKKGEIYARATVIFMYGTLYSNVILPIFQQLIIG